jgi:hypothetical protein
MAIKAYYISSPRNEERIKLMLIGRAFKKYGLISLCGNYEEKRQLTLDESFLKKDNGELIFFYNDKSGSTRITHE